MNLVGGRRLEARPFGVEMDGGMLEWTDVEG